MLVEIYHSPESYFFIYIRLFFKGKNKNMRTEHKKLKLTEKKDEISNS